MAIGAESIPLEWLRSGERATVAAVVGAGDACRRVAELGFQEGATVEMVRPGEPCILRIDGAKFCLRLAGACRILVEPFHVGT